MSTDKSSEPENARQKPSLFSGRLFKTQLSMLRGVRTRLRQLSRARSADRDVLDAQRNNAFARFQTATAQTQIQQAANWRSAITNWDIAIDKQIAVAERETLNSIHEQRQQSKRLKSDLVNNKAQLKDWFESSTNELLKKLDDSKIATNKSRDSIKAKLENERTLLEQQMLGCREWIGIRSSNTRLQSMQATNTTENSKTAAALLDLNSIAKRFEETKKTIASGIDRMQNHPACKLSGSYWFLAACPLAAIVAASIAWAMQCAPLIIVLTGVVSAIVFAILLHFIALPLVTRTVARCFPPVVEQEQLANMILMQGKRIADLNCQNEIAKHEQLYKSNQFKLDESRREKRAVMHEEFERNMDSLTVTQKERRTAASVIRKTATMATNAEFAPKITTLEQNQSLELQRLTQTHRDEVQSLEDTFFRSQKYTVERWTSGCNETADFMKVVQHTAASLFPAWSDETFTTGQWPRVTDSLAWKIGDIQPYESIRNEVVQLGLPEAPPVQPWPIFYDLMSHGALVLETQADCKEVSNQIVRNTLLRAVTSVPAGSINITIIDPEGLGKQFSWLMALADVDPALVNHRVWTQPLHISDQLAMSARHVEDIIQQSLRNRHRNLIEYNRQAGPMAVPYRLIVWDNFPFGLDDHSWQSLCSILSSGGKCGVGVILQVSDTHVWPTFADRTKLDEFGLRLKLQPDVRSSPDDIAHANKVRISVNHPELSGYAMTHEAPPLDERLLEIMEHQLEAAADVGKCIVPFESIALSNNEWQTTNASEGLAIPVGVSDSGRVQSLKLGAGTAQHVLIAGKTGSGKSSLLHTLITSAAMKYSPEQLRMVLLDFKKGVEFQVYSQLAMSHADIIGIESKREFGVSTLEYIDRLLHARGEAFRQWGVQDLPSLARKYPQHALPRILILIDEFQELFVEDDKLSQQASMLMDRIVRQGRSFGVHLILASQTLGGAYSLPRTTLSQMAVRIALQCDSSDAMLILSEDNTAAERLRHSGQAIYNETGGRIESNQSFQVAFVEKNDQVERLSKLQQFPIPHSAVTNSLGRQIVFEGHKPAVWEEPSISLAVSQMRGDTGSLPMILGDSVSIDPPIFKALNRNAGRNVMVVGQDESCAASLLAGTMAGFCYANGSQSETPSIYILDGSRVEDESMRALIAACPQMSVPVQVSDVRSIEETMSMLQRELDRRASEPNTLYPTLLVAIANISRFRELRRNEEFSFGDDAGGVTKPDAVLTNILRDGPTLGIHVWIWADSASTLTRWIARQSMRDIELRVLMQMSANDSNQLIDSNAANRLDRYVALVHDDIEGKSIKFRPFELKSVLNKLEKKG